MDSTILRLARVLGATGLEGAGHDARFAVEGKLGGHLKVSVEGAQQRLMGVLTDGQGVTRCTLDVAPITHVTEDKAFSGRITLHIGQVAIHIDTKPTLAIEIVTDVEPSPRLDPPR